VDITRFRVSDPTQREAESQPGGGGLRRAWKPTLQSRFVLILVGVTLLSLLISSSLLYDLQRRQLIEQSEMSVALLSNTLETSLRHAMLDGERVPIDDLIESIVAEPQIEKLHIMDRQGVVSFSSESAEVGTLMNETDPDCQACHAGNPVALNSTVITRSESGTQKLLNVNVIQNDMECHACHDPGVETLGIMMIETSLAGVEQQLISGFWRTGLVGLGTIIVLVTFIGIALNRSVILPISRLSKGVAQIGVGNLDEAIPTGGQDEIGELMLAFEDMRQKLKRSHAEQEQNKHNLAVLNEVALGATQLLDVQNILEFTLDTMINQLGMSAGLIFLWDEVSQRYILRASRNIPDEQIEEIDRRRKGGWDITREVAESGQEVIITDIPQDYRLQGLWDDRQGQAYIKLPLLSRGTVVGVLSLITPVGQPVTQPRIEYLKAIGREVGIAIDNAMLLEDTRRSEQQANALYQLGTKISASLALDDVLDAVADSARELLQAEIGLVGLLEADSQEVIIMAVAGDNAENLKGKRVPVHSESPGNVLMKGQAIISNSEHEDAFALNADDATTDQPIASFLAVPLVRGERFLGLVEVMIRQPRNFRQVDAQLLMRLAHHVVVAVENAQLYHQLRYLASLEERDRLAREMHDHLAQSLGYLNVRAAMTDDLLSAGKYEQALENLHELKRAAKIVYKDVREEIFNLRTAVIHPKSFFTTLQDYLAEYRTYYGVNVELMVEATQLFDFEPETGSQLLRIIQEALGNVRKHSGASYVRVHFHMEGDTVLACIEDNGQGFIPGQAAEVNGQHYGLQIMRERAESVGGSLILESQPGQGTRVLVRLPAA